jgi:hypothetical protein
MTAARHVPLMMTAMRVFARVVVLHRPIRVDVLHGPIVVMVLGHPAGMVDRMTAMGMVVNDRPIHVVDGVPAVRVMVLGMPVDMMDRVTMSMVMLGPPVRMMNGMAAVRVVLDDPPILVLMTAHDMVAVRMHVMAAMGIAGNAGVFGRWLAALRHVVLRAMPLMTAALAIAGVGTVLRCRLVGTFEPEFGRKFEFLYVLDAHNRPPTSCRDAA